MIQKRRLFKVTEALYNIPSRAGVSNYVFYTIYDRIRVPNWDPQRIYTHIASLVDDEYKRLSFMNSLNE